jgi:cytochrome b561
MTTVISADVPASSDRLRYSNVAIVLHWAIAAFILYNLASGLLRPVLPRGFFVFHVSSGVTILALSLVRVVWRLLHKAPEFLPMRAWERGLAHLVHILLYVAMLALPLSGWALVSANPPAGSPGAAWAAEHRPAPPPTPVPAASDSHAQGGPAGAGEGGGKPRKPRGPTMVWGLFKLPLIGPIHEIGREPDGVPHQRELHEQIEQVHLLGGWIMLALLVLHVGGALKHQFVDRERELARMGVGTAERRANQEGAGVGRATKN